MLYDGGVILLNETKIVLLILKSDTDLTVVK